MTAKEKTNPQKTARIAGFLYLLIFIAGMFAELFVRDKLIVPGDAATTVQNILASESLFRLGFVISLLRQIFLILLPLVLYRLLKPVNNNQAVLMAVFALVSVPIGMLSLLNEFAALLLLSGTDYSTVFTADQLHAQVMFFLDLQVQGGMISQLLAVWLLPLGYLIIKSGFLPRILGVLIVIACFGYLIDFATFDLFPYFEVTISLFTFWGEMLFALWLLIMGVNVAQWEKRALESA
jgi:hypothetical protein